MCRRPCQQAESDDGLDSCQCQTPPALKSCIYRFRRDRDQKDAYTRMVQEPSPGPYRRVISRQPGGPRLPSTAPGGRASEGPAVESIETRLCGFSLGNVQRATLVDSSWWPVIPTTSPGPKDRPRPLPLPILPVRRFLVRSPSSVLLPAGFPAVPNPGSRPVSWGQSKDRL